MSLPFVLVGLGEGPRGLSHVPSLRARRVRPTPLKEGGFESVFN